MSCLIKEKIIDVNWKLLPEFEANDLIAIFCQLHRHNYININRRQNKLCAVLKVVFGRTIDKGQFSAMKKKVDESYENRTLLPKSIKKVFERYDFIHDCLKS